MPKNRSDRFAFAASMCHCFNMKQHGGGCDAPSHADPDSDDEVTLDALPTDQLVTAIVNSAHQHRNMRIVIGRLAAELHQRDGQQWTYRRLAELTQVSPASLLRWARPFLGGEHS